MKNNEMLLYAIGEVDEELVPDISEDVRTTEKDRNEKTDSKPVSSKKIFRVAALFASVAAVIAIVFFVTRQANEIHMNSGNDRTYTGNHPTNMKDNVSENGFVQDDKEGVVLKEADTDTQFLLATATYPDTVQYNAGRLSNSELESTYTFFEKTAATVLADADKNVIYSPISLYMSLAMSAEITEGNSQRQITALLGLEDLKTIRQTAKNIWELSYMDNGKSKVIPSASLWLNVAETYKKSVIELLAKNYYASVFGGDPASGEYVERLRKWLNDHTDGLLKDYVSKIKMSPAMIITLASTLNFSGAWREKFNESKTNEDVFHTPDGDVKCDFMHTEKTSYNFGKKFSSVSFMMDNGCKMITILPDEGVTCEELLRDSEALACLSGKTLYYDIKRTHISIPKFDISSSMELEGALKALGVTDAFDPSLADFSPLIEKDNVYLQSAKQGVRVMIDEEGCRAVAIQTIDAWGAIEPDEDFYYTLDRPFLFSIVSSTNVPLFTGIVNNPA